MIYSKAFAGREFKGYTFDKDGFCGANPLPETMTVLKRFGVEKRDKPAAAPVVTGDSAADKPAEKAERKGHKA